jgi:hypothetical protein
MVFEMKDRYKFGLGLTGIISITLLETINMVILRADGVALASTTGLICGLIGTLIGLKIKGDK